MALAHTWGQYVIFNDNSKTTRVPKQIEEVPHCMMNNHLYWLLNGTIKCQHGDGRPYNALKIQTKKQVEKLVGHRGEVWCIGDGFIEICRYDSTSYDWSSREYATQPGECHVAIGNTILVGDQFYHLVNDEFVSIGPEVKGTREGFDFILGCENGKIKVTISDKPAFESNDCRVYYCCDGWSMVVNGFGQIMVKPMDAYKVSHIESTRHSVVIHNDYKHFIGPVQDNKLFKYSGFITD